MLRQIRPPLLFGGLSDLEHWCLSVVYYLYMHAMCSNFEKNKLLFLYVLLMSILALLYMLCSNLQDDGRVNMIIEDGITDGNILELRHIADDLQKRSVIKCCHLARL